MKTQLKWEMIIDYEKKKTYSPQCQAPNPLILSAWMLVIRNKFSKLARFADKVAKLECR